MLRRFLIILLSIIILLSQTGFDYPDEIYRIPLIEVNNLFLVRLKLNDKHATFLIDSGSVISLVDINQNRRYGFKHYQYNNKVLIGLGGERYRHDVYDYEIKYEEQEIDILLYGTNLDNFTGKFTGILGADFLNEYNAIIDYRENILILRD